MSSAIAAGWPCRMLAGLGGMLVPVAIFLLINGSAGRGGWGAAMSTDTAFALGMLAFVGRRFPDNLRAFILTVAVVDDLVALVVIAVVFTTSLDVTALTVALAVFALILVVRARRVSNGGCLRRARRWRPGWRPSARASTPSSSAWPWDC